MGKIDRLARQLFRLLQSDTEDAIKFMLPHADRMRALGVSEDDITTLGHIAIREADYQALFPGMIMRDFAAVIAAGRKTPQEIIEHYEKG
jgi:hypothetical protein